MWSPAVTVFMCPSTLSLFETLKEIFAEPTTDESLEEKWDCFVLNEDGGFKKSDL